PPAGGFAAPPPAALPPSRTVLPGRKRPFPLSFFCEVNGTPGRIYLRMRGGLATDKRRREGHMTVISAALLLFLVMDPLGNIPLLLAALKAVPPERQLRV